VHWQSQLGPFGSKRPLFGELKFKLHLTSKCQSQLHKFKMIGWLYYLCTNCQNKCSHACDHSSYLSIPSRKDGLVNDIIESIMTPGYTPNSVIQLMYKAFYALFFTLFLLLLGTSGNLHVLALLIISICLFLSVRW
jgi:ER protein Pkr1